MGLNLRQNNPWVIGSITNFDDGTQSLDRPRLKHVASEKDKYHTVKAWDDLQSVAFMYYGDSKFWFILSDVNELLDPFILDIGTTLIIPDIDKLKAIIL